MNKLNATPPLEMAVLEQAAGVLRVLAHPHRLKIVELLSGRGKLSVGDLSEVLGLPHSAVSQHLNHMRAHQILDVKREGRVAYYRVCNPNATNVINCIRKHGRG